MQNDSLAPLPTSSADLKAFFWVSGNSADQQKVNNAVDLILLHAKNTSKAAYSLEVANILHGFQVDQETLIATILSDRDLLDFLPDSLLEKDYGKSIKILVHSVRRLNTFRNCDNNQQATPTVPEQAERLRRMLLAMTKDVRAVLIKLAWRLYHLRILSSASYNKRHCVAQETLDIFAPLANRLGVSQMKWELEDLSFRYLDPITYKQIAKALSLRRIEREAYIAQFVKTVKELVQEHKINAEVYGRPKHIYSIYKKMQRKQLDSIDHLYDLRAIRIIVDTQMSCYRLLGEIHSKWKFVPDEFDDYISNKKTNGYQSLHTVVFGPEGKTIEIQLRTQDMHTFAELGVAAHWRYKEGGAQNAAMEHAVSSLRELLVQDETDKNLLEDFQTEIFPDRVFALTPKGDVMDLPKGSTPLDFAYAVHTQVGHRCRGAKVNGRMVPLTYQLQNGDQVEVLTNKEVQPNRSWLNTTLNYLHSSRARNAVRHWFRRQNHETNKKDGQAILDRELKRLGNIKYEMDRLVKYFHMRDEKELLISLGRGDVGIQQLSNVLSPPDISKNKVSKPITSFSNIKSTKGIQVEGVDNMLINIANCCKPVPGDKIKGYITLGRGVSIHRTDCHNISENNLSDEQKSRLVQVSWGSDDTSTAYSVDIHVSGLDRPGLLRDVSVVMANDHANILEIKIQHEANTLMARLDLTVQITGKEQLDVILSKLSELPSVVDASRAG